MRLKIIIDVRAAAALPNFFYQGKEHLFRRGISRPRLRELLGVFASRLGLECPVRAFLLVSKFSKAAKYTKIDDLYLSISPTHACLLAQTAVISNWRRTECTEHKQNGAIFRKLT
jgi:hypothetical protein